MGEYYGTPVKRSAAKATTPGSSNEYWEPCTTSNGENHINDPVTQKRDITYCSRSPCPYQSRAASRARSRSVEPWSDSSRNGFRLRVQPSCEMDVDLMAPGGRGGRRVVTIQRAPLAPGCQGGRDQGLDQGRCCGLQLAPSKSGESLDCSSSSPHDDWELLVSEDSERPIYVRKSRGVSDVKIVFEDGRGCRSRVRLQAAPSSGNSPLRTTEDQSYGKSDIKSSEMFADNSEEALERSSFNDFNSLRRRWSLWAVRQCAPRRRKSVTVTIDSFGTSGTSLRGSQGSMSSGSDDELPCNPCRGSRKSTVSIQWATGQSPRGGGGGSGCWERKGSWGDLEVKPRTGRYDHWKILQQQLPSDDEDDYCPRDADPRDWDSGFAAKPPPTDAPSRSKGQPSEFETAETQGVASEPSRRKRSADVYPEGPFESDADAEDFSEAAQEGGGKDKAMAVTEPSRRKRSADVYPERPFESDADAEDFSEAAQEGGGKDKAMAVTDEENWEDPMSCPEEGPVAGRTAAAEEERPEGEERMTTTAVAVFTLVLAIILFAILSNWLCVQRSRGPSVNPF